MFLIRRDNHSLEAESLREPAFAAGRQIYGAKTRLIVEVGEFHAYRGLLQPGVADRQTDIETYCIRSSRADA